MPLTQQEQAELDQLEYESLLAEKKAVEPATAPVSSPAAELKPASETVPDELNFIPLSFGAGTPIMVNSKVAKTIADKLTDMGIRAAGPAIGQAVGMLGGPFAEVTVPAGGAIGGMVGEVVANYREGSPNTLGKTLRAGVEGAIPGASLVKGGVKAVAKEGLKYATGSTVGQYTESLVDKGEVPSMADLAVSNVASAAGAPLAKLLSKAGSTADADMFSQRDAAFKALRSEGVVVPPHEVGAGSDTLSSFAGKAALQQEAAKRNQFAWQKLAREDIGLPKKALPISQDELNQVRTEAGEPYREIQTIQREAQRQLDERLAVIAKEADPHQAAIKMDAIKDELKLLGTVAAAKVDDLKKARDAMQSSRKAFFSGDPNAYQPWQNAKAESQRLEDAIEKAAAELGDKTMVPRLREARTAIAKTYNIEEALNVGNGFVDPLVFGRQLANGERLTGNLEKIARFQLAFRREAVEAGRVPAPGVGNINAMATTGMASRGDAPGLIGAAANMTIGRAARPYLLSDFVQGSMLNPVDRQNFAAVMARYLADNAPESRRNSEQREEPALVGDGSD